MRSPLSGHSPRTPAALKSHAKWQSSLAPDRSAESRGATDAARLALRGGCAASPAGISYQYDWRSLRKAAGTEWGCLDGWVVQREDEKIDVLRRSDAERIEQCVPWQHRRIELEQPRPPKDTRSNFLGGSHIAVHNGTARQQGSVRRSSTAHRRSAAAAERLVPSRASARGPPVASIHLSLEARTLGLHSRVQSPACQVVHLPPIEAPPLYSRLVSRRAPLQALPRFGGQRPT